MKIRQTDLRILFAFAFMGLSILFSTLPANAQSSDSTGTPEARAAALTEKMKLQLPLTAAQYPKVQAINLKYAQKNEAIFKGTEGKFAKFRSMKSSQNEKSKEMKALLSKDQYKKYAEMMEEMKSKAMEQYKSRRGSDN